MQPKTLRGIIYEYLRLLGAVQLDKLGIQCNFS